MQRSRIFSRYIFSRLLNLLPHSVLREIEFKVQLMLGKGWGTETISAETDTIAYFIRKKSIKDVVALDVGANFGNWSAELLTILPFARIFAFNQARKPFLTSISFRRY